MSDPTTEGGDTRKADHREARNRLRRAWTPFFARYGSLLIPQVSAIPPVMDGRNVVLCAATASGKTEAVVAPTAERFLTGKWGSMSVVYVIPTRALANDTLLRIQGPLEDLGISVALKHGDKPLFNPRKPPDWLITTPESLDSLLCRHTESLLNVRSVILDELHLLDNTYRGDQLRVLLRRLRHHSLAGGFNTHALSATLGDPADVAQRYVDRPVIVSVPGKRTIRTTFVESPLQVRALAPSRGWRKALFFCNRRASVEDTAKDIAAQWAPYPVVAHHGSLDRLDREHAERVMKEERVAACVCTSTLEVGIDIGDVDVVVLVEIPHSLSTLLQRLGRGNRRGDQIDAVFVVENDEERMVAEDMLRAAEVGGLEPVEYRPDRSVAIQQAFSLLFQHSEGLLEAELAGFVEPLVGADQLHAILSHLAAKEWLRHEAGRWHGEAKMMDLAVRGEIHSNIPDGTKYQVVDVTSGKRIGDMGTVFDHVFVLGRRSWEIVAIDRLTVKVRPFVGRANSAMFRPHGTEGKYAPLLPTGLRTAR